METKCACGRSSRHRGRCSARRYPNQGFMSGEPNAGKVPVIADPLGKARSIPPDTIMLNICKQCGGPKSRSPYAVCNSCMGKESMQAERRSIGKLPSGVTSHGGCNGNSPDMG